MYVCIYIIVGNILYGENPRTSMGMEGGWKQVAYYMYVYVYIYIYIYKYRERYRYTYIYI